MDWQLVASYFTVKSTDKFYSVEQLDWPLKTLKERRKQTLPSSSYLPLNVDKLFHLIKSSKKTKTARN